MTTFIPKMARKIIASPQLQREYFLKPYGLDVEMNRLRFLKIKTIQDNILNTNLYNIK